METAKTNRFQVIDALRGTASFGVCFAHLTYHIFGPHSLIKLIGGWGTYGVQIFFVISGFIIPYTLWKASYRLRNYGTFILKRLIRLDPPYLLVVFFLIPLGYLSAHAPGYNGPPFHVTVPQVLLHVGYLNVFFGNNWLNGVFWTLAIEFQYYLLVGIMFPLISTNSFGKRALMFVFLALLAIAIPIHTFIFQWLFIFMLGMLVFQYFAALISLSVFFVWLGFLGTAAGLTLSPSIAIVAVMTALTIAFAKFSNAPLNFLGKISYSLYLIHEPVGRRVINLGERFATNSGEKYVILLAGLASAMGAAWLLYWFVERPAQRWSSAITFNKRKPEAALSLPDKSGTEATGATVVLPGSPAPGLEVQSNSRL